MKKFSLLAAAGAGYVLGARAGRERYEQIRTQAQRLARNPRVQDAAHRAQDTVVTQAHHAADLAKDRAGAAADKVRSQGDHNGATPTGSTPPPYEARP